MIAMIFLTACDPYYSISITNKTDDTTTVFVKENNHFRAEKQKVLTTVDGFDLYRIAPGEEMRVGSAIAGN